MPENKPSAGVLKTYLMRRGVAFPADHGAEVKINCFNPRHQDEDKSLAVNVVKSRYVCSVCGIKGNAYTFLRKFEGKDQEETVEILRDFGWSDANFAAAEKQMQIHSDEKAGLPKHVEEPLGQLNKHMPAVETWDYPLSDGTLAVRMVKYRSKRSIKVLPYVPSSRGGWWMSGPLADNLPGEDRLCDKHPLYRLPELLSSISAERQIWVLKGETSVDAMLAVPPESFSDGGPPPCTHVPVRIRLDRIDLSPLAGHKVLLISDKDSGSRDFMRELGAHLVESLGCKARYCLPPGEGGYSIANELAEGGWEQAKTWAQGIGVLDHDELPTHAKSPDNQPPPVVPLDNTDHFTVLGIVDDTVVFQVKSTYQIVALKKTSLNGETTLLTLAPLEYWMSFCDPKEGMGRTRRIEFADKLIRAGESKGMFDAGGSVLGRGAAKAGGKVAYNLGDGLLLESPGGDVHVASEYSDHDEIFVPGQRIKVADAYQPDQARGWSADLAQAIILYRFLTPDMARALVGWIVTSIIGGCLDFRPMIWLSAPAGTGKTFLIEKILSPVFGKMLRQMGDVTEAGISATMGYDSLPACIDEFEPGGGRNEQEKWLKILSLIRLSTSGAGYRVRGGMREGGARAAMSHPRFSVLLSSINQPQSSTADQSRFYQIRLGGSVSDWVKIQDKLSNATEHAKTLMIRTHIIRNAARIAAGIDRAVKESVGGGTGIPTREAQLLASLTVGANFMMHGIVGCQDMISRREEDKVEDDSFHILSAILTALVRVPPRGEEMTLGECLTKSIFGTPDQLSGKWSIGREEREIGRVAERHGLKLVASDCGEIELLCNPRCTPLQQLLTKTDHKNIDLRKHLMNLPGVHQPMTGDGKYPKRVTLAGRVSPVIKLPESIVSRFDLAPCNVADVTERDQSQQLASAATPVPSDFDDVQM